MIYLLRYILANSLKSQRLPDGHFHINYKFSTVYQLKNFRYFSPAALQILFGNVMIAQIEVH